MIRIVRDVVSGFDDATLVPMPKDVTLRAPHDRTSLHARRRNAAVDARTGRLPDRRHALQVVVRTVDPWMIRVAATNARSPSALVTRGTVAAHEAGAPLPRATHQRSNGIPVGVDGAGVEEVERSLRDPQIWQKFPTPVFSHLRLQATNLSSQEATLTFSTSKGLRVLET